MGQRISGGLMKYSYFSGIKAGKYFLRNAFLKNGKSTGLLLTGETPAYGVTFSSDWKWNWYWENDTTGALETHTYQDVAPKNNEEFIAHTGYHNEVWFPIATKGVNTIKRYLKDPDNGINASHLCPGNFSDCFDNMLEQDLLVNPMPLLGYLGLVGSNKINTKIEAREKNMLKTDFVDGMIEKLKTRKNIIPYKSDIRHLARQFFTGTGRIQFLQPEVLIGATEKEYVIHTEKKINSAREYPNKVAALLTELEIPYEMFDLDNGDYESVFGLSNVPYRRSMDAIFEDNPVAHNVAVSESWISEYVKDYP